MKNKKNKFTYTLLIYLSMFLACQSGYLDCINCDLDYTGYIIDSLSQKPVAGIYVKDIASGQETFSDSIGYFKISYSKNLNTDLFFYKENFANDTLNTINIWGNSGQKPKLYRRFIGEKIKKFYYKDKKK
jgi:hypothetical protein